MELNTNELSFLLSLLPPSWDSTTPDEVNALRTKLHAALKEQA